MKNKPKQITGLEYFAPSKEFWWDISSEAIMYKLEMAPFEGSMESNEWDEVVMTPATKINYNAPMGEWIFRILAMNELGFSEPSESILVYIGNNFS